MRLSRVPAACSPGHLKQERFQTRCPLARSCRRGGERESVPVRIGDVHVADAVRIGLDRFVPRGRKEAAGAFERLRSPVEVTGIREGAGVVVFEFSRPWWKRRRALHTVGASLGLRADQAVWLLNGQIRKIETREHVPRRA
jgi:hypothetical protein